MWFIAVFGEIFLCMIATFSTSSCVEANLATKQFIKRKLERRKLSDFLMAKCLEKAKLRIKN
jgi:hypothetical protein